MFSNITMIDSGLDNFNKLDNFLRASQEVKFSGSTKTEKYTWIENVLNKFKFKSLKKKGRGLVREYIQKMTGYSKTQLSQLILQYLEGRLFLKEYQPHVEHELGINSKDTTVQYRVRESNP